MDYKKKKLNVFFDESLADDLILMGALAVPKTHYDKQTFIDLKNDLPALNLHFTGYKIMDKPNYQRALEVFIDEHQYLNLNVVAFDSSFITHAPTSTTKNDLIYEKLPERALYGAIRNVSKFEPTEIDMYIEESSKYAHLELHKKLKTQLNAQSLYRNDYFSVNQSNLYPKKIHPGIEIVDIFLGIISIIIRNESIIRDNGSRKIKLANKKEFIYENRHLLEDFLSKIGFYEVNGNSGLAKRNFSSFFNTFILDYENER